MFRVEIDDLAARQKLKRLVDGGANLRPLMQSIGEALVASTQARFRTGTDPDGSAWLPNAQRTIERYLAEFSSSFSKKTGRLTARGAQRAAGKKPLTGITRALQESINYRADSDGVEVGSPMIYASTHQSGRAPTGGFKARIPARPFLGLSSDDEQAIRDAVADYLESLIR